MFVSHAPEDVSGMETSPTSLAGYLTTPLESNDAFHLSLVPAVLTPASHIDQPAGSVSQLGDIPTNRTYRFLDD